MVRLLLEYGADMTDTMGSDRDASALLRAALLGNVDVMRVMVEEFGADLNSDDDDGEGARCLVSAVRNDHVPMASLLLFHGVSVRAVLNENDELVDAALNTLTNRERVGSVAMMNVLRRYSRRQRTP
jgi:ankyrin repeat protein